MECKIEKNKTACSCTYDPCPRKGLCCDCVAYHKRNNEIPGCLFPPDTERTYDRSVRKFVECMGR